MAWATTSRNHAPLSEPEVRVGQTALLVVDMQYFDADPDHGIGLAMREQNRFKEVEEYFQEVALIRPRIARLLDVCRWAGMDVIHTRVRSLTLDGRDINPTHKKKGLTYPPGSKEVEFLPELSPLEGEIVVDKTSTSIFNSTNIDRLLRNMGISSLIVAGVDTCYCVESSIRDAADLGYEVVLVGDACATNTVERNRLALEELDNDFCVVRSTDHVVAVVRQASAASRG